MKKLTLQNKARANSSFRPKRSMNSTGCCQKKGKSNSVKLSFAKNKLEITANSPEVGEAKENLAVTYKGPDMAIAFNPKYVIDPLNALTDDEVFLELIDELSPGVLKINGPFLYVVMPMRLS